MQIALSTLNKRNSLGLLPTGYGKTLCIVLPSIIQSFPGQITLVISPLTSLIDDQIESLGKWNFSCAKISALSEMDQTLVNDIKDGCMKSFFPLQNRY